MPRHFRSFSFGRWLIFGIAVAVGLMIDAMMDYRFRQLDLTASPPPIPGFGGRKLAISLPFMTAGVLLTLKRLRSANLPLWLVVLFFVPVIKIILFLLLVIIPQRGASSGRATLPDLGGNPVEFTAGTP